MPCPEDDAAARRRGHPPTRVSFGLVVVRRTRGFPEALLVRGRHTYEFSSFVLGRYAPRNVASIQELFRGMTVGELFDVYRLDFAQMWYRLWLGEGPDCQELYQKKYSRFYTLWLRADGGAALRRHIVEAGRRPASAPSWSFPKGRKIAEGESDIDCAVREFGEETRVPRGEYRVLPGFRRRAVYSHMGVTYVGVFYAALAAGAGCRPAIDVRDTRQVSEVEEVRWMSIQEIRLVDPRGHLASVASAAFAFARRRGDPAPPRCSLVLPPRRRKKKKGGAPPRSPPQASRDGEGHEEVVARLVEEEPGVRGRERGEVLREARAGAHPPRGDRRLPE